MSRKEKAARGSWEGLPGGGTGLRAVGGRSRSYSTPQPKHGQIKDGVWRKVARASLHMLRTPRAWALDAADLDAAEAAGAKFVCIQDLESLQEHWATLETLRRFGFVFDRGHGRQIGLALDKWAHRRAEAALDAEAEGVTQLSLFGGRP